MVAEVQSGRFRSPGRFERSWWAGKSPGGGKESTIGQKDLGIRGGLSRWSRTPEEVQKSRESAIKLQKAT